VAKADPLIRAGELFRSGQLDPAAEACRQLLRKRPGHAETLCLLAEILVARGDDAAALPHAENAVRAAPAQPATHVLLGGVLLRQGSVDRATDCFREALRLDPESAAGHRHLGDVLHATGDLSGAIASYRRAVERDAGVVDGWWGLGCAQSSLKQYAAAASSLRRVVQLAPNFGEAWHNLGKVLFELGDVDAALGVFDKAEALLGPNELTLGMIATIIPGSSRVNNQAILETRRDLAARYMPSAAVPVRQPRPGEKLRIGYVSSFFHHRNWMKPVWGVVNQHDRDRFEIHLFSDAPATTLEPGYGRDPRDHVHDITGQSNAEVAGRIREANIDVLIDLNGYSKLARMALFALRPAPIQIAWFNHYATSGLSCFDAIFGDACVIPTAEEQFCTEPVVRVPACYLAFEVGYPVPDITAAPCVQRGHITFGSLAPQYKTTPEVVAVWSNILRACPSARLVLKSTLLGTEEGRRYVLDQFARGGVDTRRVELEGPAEHFQFLAKYADVDVALDTFPYNGGTTTMEALWQGVPVLTFHGDRWAGRISASLLRAAGLSEFVAADVDGYVARAVELANAPDTADKLTVLRQSMRERLSRLSVCDVRGQARFFEQEFDRLCSRA
jgi:protein O-GlcNAc transferase